MVRSALVSKQRIGQGPVAGAAFVPAASVIAASFLATLPIIVQNGWFPDFGFLVLIAWRLLRADVWPTWGAVPLGLVNDLVTGLPIGLSVTIWTLSMLALDILDRRTAWRDYWIEWALAAVLLLLNESVERWVAGMMGAALPIVSIAPPLLISIFTFPIAAWIIARLDQWRLGR